ncbi:MAG: NADH-quinone oxidoreductase subunit NuoG [Alphaproteobacteria bacterium]
MSEDSLINIKINSKEIQVDKNLTVMQACEIAGEEIPRFCYHDKLSIAGNCRMCLVEIEKAPKLVSSCTMPLMDGMSIITNSEKVKAGRKGVMEFLLINHPLDCPICDQGGECDLQDQAMYYGFDKSRYHENKRAVDNKNMGPLVNTIMTRCIHCTRCVRFATEVAGVPEIGMLGRGENAEITTYLEQSITSELSGNVIDLCPVGALTSKPYQFKARPWELKRTDSIDIFDAIGSNIRIDSRAQEILRVTPRANDLINEEWITDKVRFNYDGYYQQRIDQPYIRKNGKLEPVSWPDALKSLKQKLKQSKPLSVIGDQVDIETGYAVKKFMKNFGENNVECRTDNQAIIHNNIESIRFNTPLTEIENADLIILGGTNPRIEAPIINHKIFKAYNNFAEIFNIGENLDLNYPTHQIGNDLSNLNSEDLQKALKKSKNPLMIIGSGFLSNIQDVKTLKALFEFSYKNKIITEEKNNLNFLTPHASRIGNLLLGNTTNIDCQPLSSINKKDFDIILSFGSEVIANSDFENLFKVYFGHHGDEGALKADIILPTPLYTEKYGTFVNIEGRPQEAKKCHNPIGQAKEEWAILKELSNQLSLPFEIESFEDLRENLSKNYPELLLWNNIISIQKSEISSNNYQIENCKPIYPISNFYMADVISKNSITMAKCVEEILSKPLLEKSA